MDQLDTFLDALKIEGNLSSNTIEAYAGDLRRFNGYLNSHRSTRQTAVHVTPEVMTRFLDAEDDSGFSPSTLQRRKMVLSQYAQYLVTIGVFDVNEVEEIHQWQPNLWQKIYRQDILVLSRSEIEQLLKPPSAQGPIKSFRDLAIVSLLLETGLLISAVLSLQVSQIDNDKKMLSVISGGRRNYRIPRSAPSISKYLVEERPEVTQSMEDDILFISQLGGPISRQGGWQIIKNIGGRLGLQVPLSPRVLRHTAVRLMIENGLNSNEIQDRLGHTNIYSTRALIRKIKRAIKIRKDENHND